MSAKGTVLVVDDEPNISDLISYALTTHGYDVETAGEAAEALKKAAARKFDIAVMDIQMPGMDGITALGELKKIDPEIEVVIATGHGTMSSAVQSLRKGAADFISKPFDVRDLLKAVERAVEKRRFNDITRAILTTVRPEEQLRVIVDSVTRLLKAEESLLALPDREGRLRVAVAQGLDDEAARAARLELCARVLAQDGGPGTPEQLEAPGADRRYADIPGLGALKHSLFLPLADGGRPSGIIALNRLDGGRFGDDELQRARLFGSLVNLALRNSSLYRQLQDTQGQLIQAEKMSALGQLAGGLAHEINNPLSGILGLTQLVLETLPPDGQNYADLKEIEKAVFRCKKIIVSLLSFSRQEKTRTEPLSVNEAVEETLTLCARQMELKNVKITRKLAPGLPLVNGDYQQLMQVFLNLFTNARDAMPEGGELTVATSAARGKDGGETVEIAVSDTGAGIDPEILGRIFDPFFTTKPVGKGTGLGLSVCLGIIGRHSGQIKAASVPGEGSTFTVSIPV